MSSAEAARNYIVARPHAAYARRAASWARRGATVVGGCCGTTPAHTKACRVLFDRQRRRSRFFGYLTFLAVVLAVLATL